MKKSIFLVGSLLLSSISFAQTYSAPASAGDNGTTNVYLGEQAGSGVNNTGGENTFVGYKSGLLNTSGNYNFFGGSNSGYNNLGGSQNVFLGRASGYYNTEGEYNVFLGHQSGLSNTEGNSNIYIGSGTGYSNTVGLGNTFVGRLAGYTNLGSKNVFIGYLAGRNEIGSNKLYISNSATASPLVYGEFDSQELKFNASKVGIGTDFGSFPALTGLANAASYRLFVRGGILAEEVRVRLQADWADYVFSDNYKLPSLKETEAFINENKHLPNMPSASQVKEEGIEMGNIIKLQQEKIEELTLYLIQQEKEIQKLKEQNNQLEDLKAKVEFLLNKE